ncbi:DMP19 family protein [Arthrobacter sp. 35W]|uniref:DMP19 family protein n=1 Tax=Arthrobacter sp. 35W TaxID=1132441 RepID=UPI0003FA5DEE|nr:DUF4375 domain-containing protein [Arthrobacter sp. 35W]
MGESLAEEEAGRNGLEALCADDDRGVRLSASIAVLKWNPKVAIPVLEDFSAGSDMNAFSAENVLRRFQQRAQEVATDIAVDEPATASAAPRGQGEVPGQPDDDDLDMAMDIHSLIMNGGVDHAYEVRGDEFPLVAATFTGCGARDAAAILDEFLRILGGGGIPADMESRADQLAAVDESVADDIEVLSDRYFGLDDVQDKLEQIL